VNTAIHYS